LKTASAVATLRIPARSRRRTEASLRASVMQTILSADECSKKKRDRFAQRLGGVAPPLEPRGQGDAELGRPAVGCQADPDVADEAVCLPVGEGQLDPEPAGKEGSRAHLFDEGEGLRFGLHRPALIAPHRCIAPVRLERRQIGTTKAPQEHPAGEPRQRLARRTAGSKEGPAYRGHLHPRFAAGLVPALDEPARIRLFPDGSLGHEVRQTSITSE
jgi:hypothetical protein